MRRSGFLLPFALGALSMLMVVILAAWSVPMLLGRARLALHPAAAAPADPPAAASTPTLPVAPVEAPVAVGRPDSARDLPFVTVPTAELPTAASAAPAVPPSAAPAAAPPSSAKLLIPVQGVAAANLVDTYDQARSQGRRHDAIDIMAARGTPVLASADGVVMKLFQSVRGGTALYELAPDRRTIYYYAHLDRYAAGMAEGRALRRGEVLGYVGNTGDAGPGNYHLHFEVSTTADPKRYWGGVPQNPYPLLR
ncbi:MAG: endopeptidase [Gemmatimonadetes bacterium]|nr:endopeptidase [Gemmatimonadota bacterium]